MKKRISMPDNVLFKSETKSRNGGVKRQPWGIFTVFSFDGMLGKYLKQESDTIGNSNDWKDNFQQFCTDPLTDIGG